MAEPKFLIESGMQLLARLMKKPEIHNFYPILFGSGPKSGDLIEISNECDTSWLMIDMICEAILHNKHNDGVGVLLFHTDGNFSYQVFLNVLKRKIADRLNITREYTGDRDTILTEALSKFYMLEIFDANQFLITIHNLDNILMEHPNICLIIFNSLTAFYWSEQGFKITKMDLYVKNLLQIIQKNTKEYILTCVYTRPHFFFSNKDIESRPAGSHSAPVLQYQMNVHQDDTRELFQIDIKTLEKQYIRYFNITDGTINWLTVA